MAEGINILRPISTTEPHRSRSNSSGSRGGRNGHVDSAKARGMSPVRSRDNTNSARSSLDTVDRDTVLATLGYKAKRSWNPAKPVLENSELCLRCGKKVYPLERVDVGGYYHKGCFKCKICGIQLTLKTFHRDSEVKNPKITKEVYCKKHIPRALGSYIDSEALEIKRAVNAQKHVSSHMRGTGYDHEAHYDPNALEFQHAQDVKRRTKVHRRSTLRSSKDFEKFGVYDAQCALEAVHKQEEDELYRQMSADRKRHVDRLERQITEERSRTVQELISWFERRGASAEEREAGLIKIENFYARQREERMQLLLKRLTMEEQAAVARIIEKHSTEMLVLIQEKEREAENKDKFEFRESQLLEGGTGRMAPDQEDAEEEEEEEDSEEETEEDSEEGEEEDTQENSFSEASYHVGAYEAPADVRQITHPNVNRTKSTSYGSEGILDTRGQSGSGTPPELGNQGFDRPRGGSQREPRKASHRNKDPAMGMRHSSDDNILERKRGRSQSQRQNESFPFEFPYELDENGEVLVRVHGARNAHLIGDHLKSSHFCQSPEARKTQPFFYDLGTTVGKSPKPLRRKMADKNKDANEIAAEANKAKKGKGKTGNTGNNGTGAADGKFMLFQRPGEEHLGTSDDDGSENGRKKKNRKEGKNTTERNGTRKAKNRNRKNNEHNADLDTRLRNHTQKAREALRNMSLGLGPEEAIDISDEVFLDVQPTAPKVVPPKTKKRSLYKTPEVFKELDDNAVNESRREHSTFTELVRRLSKGCKNELQRVRAIFRWITAKDLNKLEISENVDPDSPMGILRGIKYGVESYHDVFKRLCSYAGIHCDVIEGYSKGAGYKPGGRFKESHFRNQWTAVHVEGAWRFVNCNWGSRHVKGAYDDRMTYQCEEFYFLTDPEDHIYQHYPDDPHWQLLKSPISLEDFVKLPVVKTPFFNRHLGFSMDYESTIRTPDGTAEVRLQFPKYGSFTAQLKSKDGQIKPEVLQGRVLVRIVNDEVIFLTNLPSTGNYYLEIYVGDSFDTDSMDNACSFRLCCYSVSSNAHISYPPIGCFGRTKHFKKSKLKEETHTDPYITHNGELLIAFLSPSNVRLSHTLRFWNHRDRKLEDLDRHAFMMHRSDHLVTYTIQCPRRGGYVFSLLASLDEDDSDAKSSSRMKCIYRYYIECRTPTENTHPLPKASKRWHACRIIEPMNGDLPCRSKVRFRVESSMARELVVSVNDNWFHLQRSGNLWQGVVNTGDDKGRLFLYGRFDSTKEKYIPLLEYVIRGHRRMEDEVKSLIKYM